MVQRPDRGSPYSSSKKGKKGMGSKVYTPEELRNIMWGLNSMGIGGSLTMPEGIGQTEPKNQSPSRTDPSGMNIAPQKTLRPKPRPPVAQETEQDRMDALLAELMGAVGGSGATFDYESALAQSEKAINDAYAQDIAAIRAGNRQARRQTARDRRELEGMYESLGKSYDKQSRVAVRRGNQVGNEMMGNAQDAAQFLSAQAKDLLGEQASLAEGLGIQDALPKSQEGLMDEALDQQKRIIAEGSEDANRQRGFGGNASRFFQRGGTSARLEGTNRSGDLLENLQNYIFDNRQQIAGLRGEQNREIADTRTNTMSQAAEMQAAADSEMWDRLLALTGLKFDIEKERHDQSMDVASLQQKLAGEAGSSMPGNETMANAQVYLNQLKRPKIGNSLFDNLLSSDQFLYGKSRNDTTGEEYKLTPEMAMQMIEESASQYNLRPEDVHLLRLAVRAYMG